MERSPPGSSVHGMLQARILEWVAMTSFRGSSWTRDQTHISFISFIGRWVLYHQHHLWSLIWTICCSVTQSCLSDSLWPQRLQHDRLPCSLPSSRVCSNSRPLSQWCHPIISSSVIPFSSGLQSFPASGTFPVSQLFASGGQTIGASASASVLPMNIQDWFPLGLTGLISLLSKGLSRVFSRTTVRKHPFFGTQLSSWSNSHIHTWLLEKP